LAWHRRLVTTDQVLTTMATTFGILTALAYAILG
jgi:hypothetical protein